MFNEQVLQIAERIRGLRLILDIPVSEMADVCSTTEEDYIAFPDYELCIEGVPTTKTAPVQEASESGVA